VAPAVRRAAELKAGDTQSASSGAACNNRFPALIWPASAATWDQAMTAKEVASRRRTCPLCEAMCGLTLEVSAYRVLGVRGDPEDAFSGGYICPKAVGLMDIQHDSDRLHQPLRRRNGTWEAAGWDHAVAETVQRLADIRRAHGDDAVAFYVGNPATHSYSATLAALAFAKALKTHNVFSTASVDYLPHTFAAYYNFGNRILIPVPDVDRTQFLLILGANPAVSNGSVMAAPNMARRLKDLRSRGGRLGRGRSPADPHRRPGRHVPADPARDRRLGSLYVHGKVSTQARGYWALRPPN
jgi:anaerobic selenocysteine-containing dehydrogenase